MEKRIDCPLCGNSVFPNSASGTAKNDETGINFIVCVNCDGATHTPEPDNCDHKPQYGEWLPIDEVVMKDGENYWCYFGNEYDVDRGWYYDFHWEFEEYKSCMNPTHVIHIPKPDAPKEVE